MSFMSDVQPSASTSVPLHDATGTTWSKVARHTRSTIRFASFDPATASGDHTNASAFRKLTLNEELCRPKRVVIETAPDGRSTWRFVPNARREDGVENEGIWPRVVDVCGQLRTLTQDQWDVYKLDRDFDCLVRLPPQATTITRSNNANTYSPSKPATVEEAPAEDNIARHKRRLSESAVARRLSGSNDEGKRKKARSKANDPSSLSSDESDQAEEEEVSGMVIDDDVFSSQTPRKRYQTSERLKKVKANKEEARRKRREWNAQRRQKIGLSQLEEYEEDENRMSWTDVPLSSPPRAQPTASPFPKRKVDAFSDLGEAFSDEDSDNPKPTFKPYEKTNAAKRTRTVSPVVARRAAEIKRNRREMNRKDELDRRNRARQQALHESVMKEIYEEASRSQPTASQTFETYDASQSSQSQSSQYSSQFSSQFSSEYSSQFTSQTAEQPSQEVHVDEEELRRQATIEESRRKLAELEKDKPIWEEAARKRAAKEAEEEQRRTEAARKAHAANETAARQPWQKQTEKDKARQEAAEREKEKEKEKERENVKRKTAEDERHAREKAADDVRSKRKHAREAAQRDTRAWIAKGWTGRRALERYISLSDTFDALNFFKGDVIVFETVPWPVLMRPGSFSVEDIDWTAVETFFRQIRVYLPTPEYRKLVEKSHKRFHPDRWRSRRVLISVEDEEEKECLEVAANTVAQALTPIWKDVTGR
ncbi:uncharacterized protein FOMMEDRAFT_146791 [Fomitiporia mediterranea MF3/22]|uniref:uncharacterized protein n=1 Tax=Fomitiporia mediterranea (strain MF3/22) TaxID=694068 RepID=UPI00044076C8|nr:uncharacterized protein FOMMEDRAFT_146791 [Fomitiporia mediterranea MF3/22]EJD03099.1 hypothetical protein FOMMEDRAFT_146791 [Fomitiporia mediterranea MF3/22]